MCQYIITPQLPHEHTYNVAGYDGTHHYMRCTCGTIGESTKSPHSATSDNDCTCDNPGCQILVGVPKDENDGIDLPIDRNQ